MMKSNRIVVYLAPILLASCASMRAKTEKAWDEKRASPEFLREKALFKERLGGKAPCLLQSLYNFTWNATERPSADCLYPATRYLYDPDKRIYGQAQDTLKVLQTTPKGFLLIGSGQICPRYISCYEKTSPTVIFIHKTDEQDFADGTQFNSTADPALYEYTGTISYETSFGSKTVYSFRKLPRGAVKKAHEDLKVYDLNQELFADIGAWPDLEKAMQGQQPPTK